MTPASANQPRILIIDNQITQFQAIRSKLTAYTTFPEPEEHGKVMDWVRVHLNTRYKKKRCSDAFSALVRYIEERDIDLFIMDYKLTGPHDGKTGIFLATNFVTLHPEKPQKPVIFLSGTPEKDPKVQQEELLSITHYRWVDKGYAGLSIKDAAYFKINVLNTIPDLLAAAKGKPLLQMIEELLTIDWMGAIKPLLLKLRADLEGGKEVAENLKKNVADLYAKRKEELSDSALEEFFKK